MVPICILMSLLLTFSILHIVFNFFVAFLSVFISTLFSFTSRNKVFLLSPYTCIIELIYLMIVIAVILQK